MTDSGARIEPRVKVAEDLTAAVDRIVESLASAERPNMLPGPLSRFIPSRLYFLVESGRLIVEGDFPVGREISADTVLDVDLPDEEESWDAVKSAIMMRLQRKPYWQAREQEASHEGVSTQAQIKETKISHTESLVASAELFGFGMVRGYIGTQDINLVPDKISVQWKRVDGGTWRLASCVLTGFRVLKSGRLGEQRAEWLPPISAMPPELAAWLREVAPPATSV